MWAQIASLCLLCNISVANSQQTAPSALALSKTDAPGYVGNEACAKCHAKIYESYLQTAMAHSSGPADENPLIGEFTHKPSGVHFAVYREAGKIWLSFDRPGDPLLHDKREFLYFIGEGRRGRTYLFSVDGFVFESPVNWYADRHMWDMAPAYGDAKEIPLNLPATTSCLHCHVSGVRAPLDGSENHYPSPIFFYSGIICERCHGPGAAHVTGGPIVNPAKLPAKRRDQVCMQCHLEGNAAIERAGKHIYDYKPGDDLSEYVRYFVLTGNVLVGLRATSQFEALAQSICKEKSGDAMTCTSCHDPHRAVAPENRVAFYRAKCLACHGAAFGVKHHPKQEDCTSCHMPASLSSDVAHTQVTDHRIPRRPLAQAVGTGNADQPPGLAQFPPSDGGEQDLRDLALAWQSIVNSGMSMAQPQAEQLLRGALQQSPNDPALLSGLAYAAQLRGDDIQARSLYKKALEQDPSSVDATSNLGVLEAQEGRMTEAIRLWQFAFERAPGKSAIGMNLARVFCEGANYEVARSYVLRVLRFNPDLSSAKKLLGELNANPPGCTR
ncbi:MAG TPA: tetratricopeptide repeat protein [Verrucomicrobiae bacterium]|nr:tetratricopeptide repeat protein [Verrucomicrobiae bacterium]